jgi:hypothetical protein
MTNRSLLAGFEVLTAVVVKIHIFWDITPYRFSYDLLHARSFLGLFFESEYGGNMFLRNVC